MKLIKSWTRDGIIIFEIVFFLCISLNQATASNRRICPQIYALFFESYQPKRFGSFMIPTGIEIEGSVPREVGLNGLAQAIKKTLRTNYNQPKIRHLSGINHYIISYRKYRNHHPDLMTFRIDSDHSIKTSQIPFEIASPILRDEDDLNNFKNVVTTVRKLGAKSETQSAGIHVHVDFEDASAGELASLAAIFSEIEKDLIKRFSTSKPRKKYTLLTSKELIRSLNTVLFDRYFNHDDFIQKLLSSQTRYHALNLRSYDQIGTVEFRLFNSTLDLEVLDLMRDFSLKLVKGIRTQNPDLVNYLIESKEPIQLDRVAKILEMKLAHPNAQQVLNRIYQEAQKDYGQKWYQKTESARAISQVALLLGTAAVINQVLEQSNIALPMLFNESSVH